jgi:hypothetical protein
MFNHTDVKHFAERAVHDMAIGAIDAFEDDGREIAPGDHIEHVRERALEYATDVLGDLREQVLQEIREMKFSARVEMVVDFSK